METLKLGNISYKQPSGYYHGISVYKVGSRRQHKKERAQEY